MQRRHRAIQSARCGDSVSTVVESPSRCGPRSRPPARGRVHLRALATMDEGLLGERADAERGDSAVPSAGVIGWAALWVSKQYHGCPRLQARQRPQTARQLRMTKSPGATSDTPSPTASTIPAGPVRPPYISLGPAQAGPSKPAGPRRRGRRRPRGPPSRRALRRRLRARWVAPGADVGLPGPGTPSSVSRCASTSTSGTTKTTSPAGPGAGSRPVSHAARRRS